MGAKAVMQLREEQRQELERVVSAHGTPQQVAKRCRIILLKAQGESDAAIAERVGVSRHTCRLWRLRYEREGAEGLWHIAEGRGRKMREGLAQRVLKATIETKPAGQTHWSSRLLAKAQGVHATTVWRIWRDHQLQPHRTKGFKLSRDPKFVPKLLDVVGVYLNPPSHAVVLCVDEKSQIQALDRTQPGLPIKRGRCGTMTHDYVRHGTTTLFAALNVARGTVHGQCFPRHRNTEFLRFLRHLDQLYPDPLELHLILDNYGTHGHENVRRWLAKHPRFKIHLIPTSSSWLNLVERWFAELTNKAVRRGSFTSVPDLIAAIERFITHYNLAPKPFVWTAKAEDILAKIDRCRQRLEQIQPGCTVRKSRKSKTALSA
jgi:transposase